MSRGTALRAWSLAAVFVTTACATSGSSRHVPVETRSEHGFTLQENVHLGFGVRDDFESAVRLLEKEDWEHGIDRLVEVTQAAPDLTAAYVDLGIAYGQMGDLPHAEASLQKALELDPRHPVALNEMGMIQRRMGHFSEARASYEKVLSLYPDFHYAHRNLGILCDLYLGDLPCALEQYELYAKAVPQDEKVTMWITDLKRRIAR